MHAAIAALVFTGIRLLYNRGVLIILWGGGGVLHTIQVRYGCISQTGFTVYSKTSATEVCLLCIAGLYMSLFI